MSTTTIKYSTFPRTEPPPRFVEDVVAVFSMDSTNASLSPPKMKRATRGQSTTTASVSHQCRVYHFIYHYDYHYPMRAGDNW